MKNKRPLSPHLSIYKPQITSVLSIMHRISGVYLFIGLLVMIWWFILSVYSAFKADVMKWSFFYENTIGIMMIVSWTFAFYYHLYNGIRHLLWDIGWGFELKTATRTGYLVLFLTILSTFLSWGIALNK